MWNEIKCFYFDPLSFFKILFTFTYFNVSALLSQLFTSPLPLLSIYPALMTYPLPYLSLFFILSIFIVFLFPRPFLYVAFTIQMPLFFHHFLVLLAIYIIWYYLSPESSSVMVSGLGLLRPEPATPLPAASLVGSPPQEPTYVNL